MKKLSTIRPYLVIPKLIVQPTWGGSYIVENKGWKGRPGHDVKIGQAYELFSGSNLSLLDSSDDPEFQGEITDNDSALEPTSPQNSISIDELVKNDPAAVLGNSVVTSRGPKINLLIKFTQALGNSFQVHIKDGIKHPKWKPKPESWYYFEPGILTFGIKEGVSWDEYENCVRKIDSSITDISERVKSGLLTYDDAKEQIKSILKTYDPWQFVNVVRVGKDQVVDLSSGGIHHSWEEDPAFAPQGNILLELQSEAMDDISTFRSFDKGKMAADGNVRKIHIDTYFEVIDRSPKTNDPKLHIHEGSTLLSSENYHLDKLMRSRHFSMDKLTLKTQGSKFTDTISTYRHVFVKSGKAQVSAGDTKILVGTGHSCFIPAAANQYTIQSQDEICEILLSY